MFIFDLYACINYDSFTGKPSPPPPPYSLALLFPVNFNGPFNYICFHFMLSVEMTMLILIRLFHSICVFFHLHSGNSKLAEFRDITNRFITGKCCISANYGQVKTSNNCISSNGKFYGAEYLHVNKTIEFKSIRINS